MRRHSIHCAAASVVTISQSESIQIAGSEVPRDAELNLPWERPVCQTADHTHPAAN